MKYSLEVAKESIARLLKQGALIAYNRIKALPKGSWEMKEYMDDDGHGNLVKLKVKITITEDEFIADFTGSSPQVASPINTGYSSLCARVKVIYMSILGPALAVNDGVFEPMRIAAEDGSILRCHAPAPTSCYFESMIYSF